tara:strand:- start:83 stop:1225 length:1143 start_codon:yes stop_codon:yes gene_type:complete
MTLPIKIAIIRQKYVPYGGAERFSSDLINQLASKGHDVHVFASQWESETIRNVTLHTVPTQTSNATQRILSFNQTTKDKISKQFFDLVQSHERTVCQDIYRAGDGCHIEWLRMRKKYYPFKGLFLSLNPFHKLILDIERQLFTKKNYRKIIAISEMVKENIQRHYKVPDQDIVVIYNGVDLKRFCPENREKYCKSIREAIGIPKKAMVILTVGSGFERKGLKFLLRSLNYIESEDWRLIVIGKGNWFRYSRYAPRKFRNRIIYIPPVENLNQYYSAADVFVLPSIYEPFGNVHLEALATGLPVIVSRYSGAAELITHKINGMILSDPGDPKEIAGYINHLRNPEMIESLSRQGRMLAEKFPVEKSTEKFLQLYEELLGLR